MSTNRSEIMQNAAARRKKQADLLASLPPNTLYINLYIRSDPPLSNDFHWAFYLHSGTAEAPSGTKYHVRGISDSWIPGHESTAGIVSENYLCVMIQIATLSPGTHKSVEQIMKSYDERLNSITGITCRVWLIMVLHDLVEKGFVRFDVGKLERECFHFGNEYSLSATLNEQPRPVVKSMFSS
ncbi:uncharacterized protein N7529_006084 [Penicillium soppii]|jgi:hypothetical protein|uniref:uncharacterized protein n=1 Tax=Penicillium soppii TaxID=69789 RepID=UPI002548CCD2|nr:uncharacterized protein N7529_006084 [Penicillium soppii]KAJ5864168.1 hypothetical protein N7529_006084 [Penicillium soppii]